MIALPSPFLFIADAQTAPRPLEIIVREALQGGCRWVLYRDLFSPPHQLCTQAKILQTHCNNYGASLFISRHMDVAENILAHGLHLSASQNVREARARFSHAGIPIIIGQSCHNEGEAKRAVENGADYITLSPIFETPTKPAYGPALGLDGLRALAKTTSIPVLALGGVTPQKTVSCLAAGAKGVAVMGDILRAPDAEKQMREYLGVLG